jgi:hypothetical protein
MSRRPKRRDHLDAAIVASWRRARRGRARHFDERLMEMVRGDTGADVDRQIESLQGAGILQLEQR